MNQHTAHCLAFFDVILFCYICSASFSISSAQNNNNNGNHSKCVILIFGHRENLSHLGCKYEREKFYFVSGNCYEGPPLTFCSFFADMFVLSQHKKKLNGLQGRGGRGKN